MKYSIIFLEKATVDIAHAYKYYGEIDEKLIIKFEIDLEQTIERIKMHPKQYRIIKRTYRQLLMETFSFVIVYRIINETILITRVFHTSRNPLDKFRK